MLRSSACAPLFLLFSLLPLGACSSQPAPQSAADAEPTEEGSAPASDAQEEAGADSNDDELSAEEAEALAAIEEAEAEAYPSEGGGGQPEGQREVIYRVAGQQLSIEIEGATFTPSVQTTKVGSGWGLTLTVGAETTEEMVLYAPNSGPLAFASKITRSNGKQEKYFDEREGGADVPFSPNSNVTFTRSWPGSSEAPLQAGDQLQLYVGLWGLGADSESKRPVKKFCLVNVKVEAGGAVAEILPPQ